MTTGHAYKGLIPPELVIAMALIYLPKDGTDWLPLLKESHRSLSESIFPIAAAADLPARVAMEAFERMGYQYMEVENGKWRRRLSHLAHKHWLLFQSRGVLDQV